MKKAQTNHYLSVSSIEFDKVYRVMRKRISLGFTARELSFLLGYRALYVRDAENPLHTLRYSAKDTNYLLQIFDCRIKEIMAPKIEETNFHISVEVKELAPNISNYIISLEQKGKSIEYEKVSSHLEYKVIKSKASAEKIQAFINHLFSNTYFREPKTALEVYKKCISKFGSPLQPQFVADAIAHFTGKRKLPKLIQEQNQSKRIVYLKKLSEVGDDL